MAEKRVAKKAEKPLATGAGIATEVARELGGGDKTNKLWSLPVTSEIKDQELMTEASELLEESLKLTKAAKKVEEALVGNKLRLKAILAEAGFSEGMRYGNSADVLQFGSRSTLSEKLLLDNGCPPEIIPKSKSVSEFTSVLIKEVLR